MTRHYVLGEIKQVNCEEENQRKKKRVVIGYLRKGFFVFPKIEIRFIYFFERREKIY